MTATEIPAPAPDDIQPIENETLNRTLTGTITVIPIIALFVVAWQLWADLLFWSDLIVFAIMYVATSLGITVGFHRLFTHRSFKAKESVSATLAILGSTAIEGPIISWVSDHRKHHAFSDQPGDPHSPHVDHGHGLKGALRGLAHAHLGWLFIHTQRGRHERYAPDLIADPEDPVGRQVVLRLGRGRARDGVRARLADRRLSSYRLTGLLWGGAVRMLVLHHATYSINSLCHFFGRREFETRDESRNLLLADAIHDRARPGTTTTTRSRPLRCTGCAAGRSTPRR